MSESSNDTPIPTAPPCSPAIQYSQEFSTLPSRQQQEESDAAYARILQAQENATLQASNNRNDVIPPQNIVVLPPPIVVHGPEMFNPSASALEMEDERLARALDQEMRDEELARTLQEREETRLRRATSAPHANPPQSASTTRPSRCNAQRAVSAGCFLVILGTAAVLVVVFGSSIWSRLGGDPNELPPFFRNDWGTGDDNPPGEFSQWKNNKKGLSLTVRNALTSDWDSFFVQAVKEWNEAPALQLSTQDAAEDPTCSSVRGILKVCNDFYGKTGWTGLNEIYFENNNIAASVAKMNESYLSDSSTAEKQYVMCHEIGHGFGLPHRDEIPNNPDLGSCLDYTYRFENNMHPDTVVDFQNLQNLYGVVGNRRMLQIQDSGDTSIFEKRIRGKVWHHLNGRLLHQSEHHEVYENDLGEGLRVVTTLLLASKRPYEGYRSK